MPQIFSRTANYLANYSILFALAALPLFLFISYALATSPYVTRRHIARAQPVPFSHKHHVGGLGIDCRYCHTSVEVAASAGMPPTQTCMNCHQQIWTDSPMLAPVRESWRSGTPIKWNRVNNLPDFVYFNHAVHVNGGVGCASCHGRVEEMPLMAKAQTLYMQWCLNCHGHPQPNLRPRGEIFNTASGPPGGAEGELLFEEYRIRTAGLTNCSACHR
jgi:hypothetical protein